MSQIVLDTSVIASWCFKDETDRYSDAVLELLLANEGLIPSLCPYEITNVLLVAERRKRLTNADSVQFINLLESLPIRVDPQPSDHMMNELLALSRRYKLSAYDSAYLALAMREGLPLATRDDALKKAAKKCGVEHVT